MEVEKIKNIEEEQCGQKVKEIEVEVEIEIKQNKQEINKIKL